MSEGTHAVGASGPGKGDPWGQLMLWVTSGLTSHESREGGCLSVCLSCSWKVCTARGTQVRSVPLMETNSP